MICGCFNHNNKVAPIVAGRYENYDLIEARPHRLLRVVHANIQSSSTVQTSQPSSGGTPPCPLVTPSADKLKRRASYDAPSLKCGSASLVPSDWVLFFVHGVGSSSDDWKEQIAYFKDLGYRIVAVDLIGHGMSSHLRSPHEYSFKQLASDVLAVFDQYSHSKGNVLIGHSLGCSICTYIAAKRPYALSKLVLLCGGGPEMLNSTRECCGGCCCCCCCNILSLPNCVFSLFKPCCYSYVKRQMFSQIHLKSNPNLHSSFDDVSPDVVKYTLKGQVWVEGNERFHENLRIDCQLIGATDDHLVDEEDELRMFNTMKFCRLDLLVGGSHMVMMEHPKLVNELIDTFLNQPIDISTDFLKFHLAGMIESNNGSAKNAANKNDKNNNEEEECNESAVFASELQEENSTENDVTVTSHQTNATSAVATASSQKLLIYHKIH